MPISRDRAALVGELGGPGLLRIECSPCDTDEILILTCAP